MSPFNPVGDVARWRVLYDELFKAAGYGDVITYDEMAKALGLDPVADKRLIQVNVQRVGRELEKSDDKQIEAVPNVGYRIMQPAEHGVVVKRRQKKSGRQLKRGLNAATHVDFTGMDPEVRKGLELVARALAAQIDFNRRFDVRQSKLEKALADVAGEQQQSATEIEELKARLARLEQRN